LSLGRRETSCIHEDFPVTALSSLCTTAVVFVFVLFFFFLFYFKSSKEGLLNRWRWVWGTGLGPKTHLWLSPQLGSDSEQWTHTQEELSTTGCKWTAGVTSLVWITFFKGNDIEISVFAF